MIEEEKQPNPPPLPRSRRSRNAAMILIALVLGALAANHLVSASLFTYRCRLKTLTGIPCAFCGGTRSVAAMARLDFAEALALNPLVCVSLVAAVFWLLLEMTGWEKVRTRLAAGRKRLPGAMLLWTIAAIVLANWLYLIWRGR